MENYKEEIIGRGYTVAGERGECTAFVNVKTNFCAILTPTYKLGGDNEDVHYLHHMLKFKYSFAEKSTICIVLPGETTYEGRNEIMRNEYHFVKVVGTLGIEALPFKVDKEIILHFKPMSHQTDAGDYTVDAYQPFDGMCSGRFLRWLANDVKSDDVVKYPPIINNNFFRYHAEKLFTVINHK